MDAVTHSSQSFSYQEDHRVYQPESVSRKIKPRFVKNCLDYCVSSLAHQTNIALRAITQYSWCPLKGAIQCHLPNMVTHGDLVTPSKVSDDTVVLLINNNHAAILLGGYDSDTLTNPKSSKSDRCRERILSWCPAQPFSVPATIVQMAAGSIFVASFLSKVGMPLKGLLYTAGAALMLVPVLSVCKNNSARKLFEGTYTVPSVNYLNVKDNVNAIPLHGLDTEAMLKKAEEIKENENFCLSNMNCSEAVLMILKSGLPKDQADTIKTPLLFTTPNDIRAITEDIVNKRFVSKGEIDHQGNIRFIVNSVSDSNRTVGGFC